MLVSSAAILFLSVLAYHPAHSAALNVAKGNITQFGWFKPVFTVSAGAVNNIKGDSTSFYVPDSTYQYSPHSVDHGNFLMGLGIATESPIGQSLWGVDFGLGFYQGSRFTTSGTLTQGIDIQSSDSFRYAYQVTPKALLAEAKLFYKGKNKVLPYLYFGAGSAFNDARNYQVNTSPFTFSPIFSDNISTSFSYSAGVGADMEVYKGVRFGVGYRFRDWGRTRLGTGYIDTTAISPKWPNSHHYTNEILAQLILLMA